MNINPIHPQTGHQPTDEVSGPTSTRNAAPVRRVLRSSKKHAMIRTGFNVKALWPRVVLASVIAIGSVGAGAHTASAAYFGPNLGGSASGTGGCDARSHQITLVYGAMPEYSHDFNVLDEVSNVTAVPEWIEVYGYVKPDNGNWSMVAHNQVLMSNYVTPIWVTLPATPGHFWNVGYYMRVAYPGGQWSNWIWENAVSLTTSLSGQVNADYGNLCLT